MIKPKPKSILSRLYLLLFIFIALIAVVESCKKDNHTEQLTNVTNPAIVEAKSWYESNYPVSINNSNSNLKTLATKTNSDWSQYIKPDWNLPRSYTRFNDEVIEMPMDASTKIEIGLKSSSPNQAIYNKDFSRSSFLLLKQSGEFKAYVMTIIADPDYLKGDLTKLDRNKYNKRDSDFSGVVLYATPKGKFVNGWLYKNGTITGWISPNGASHPGNESPGNEKTVQNVKTNGYYVIQYVDYYQYAIVENGGTGGAYDATYAYIGTSFTAYVSDGNGTGTVTGEVPVNGGGGGSGGGTSPYIPPPCPDHFHVVTNAIGSPKISIAKPPDQPLPIDGGFPPPEPQAPCVVRPVSITIRVDSLAKHFPCAVALVINNLTGCGAYSTLVQAFTTSQKPDLTWKDGSLPWNSNSPLTGNNSYQLGQTETDPTSGSGQSFIITLNNNMLSNSSMLLIGAAAIHETLHAYIGSNIALADYNVRSGFNDYGSWFAALDAFYSIRSLPPNYRDHYEMLADYFDKATASLASFDNNHHTTKEYQMAMLFGLNTVDVGCPADVKARLDKVFNDLLTKNSITSQDLSNFNQSQLNAPPSAKLPTSGCN